MNTVKYLQNENGNAWLMNDEFYMVWEKQRKIWVVKENPGEPLKHKIVYEGNSLEDALSAMRGK